MRSRNLVLALVLLVSRPLGAQQPPSTVSPLPPIGFPLAPIGLPLPTITPALPQLGVPPGPLEATALPRRHQPERRSPRGLKTGHSAPFVLVVPDPYGWWTGPIDRPHQAGEIPADPRGIHEAGRLRLDVEPADAQLFIDSVYVGTPGDPDTIELDPGIHRLAIVAPGTLPARCDLDEMVTYTTGEAGGSASNP